MKFERLLEIVGEEPVFETGLLLAGDVAPFLERPADLDLVTLTSLEKLLQER